MTRAGSRRCRPANPNPSSNNLNILIDRDIDALYRAMTPSYTRCGSDAYTRFRYLNNKNAVIRRCAAAGEGADISNLLKLLQARFACRSARCLADNPGKSEEEFTHNGKTRPKYAKRPNPTSSKRGGTSRKSHKPSPDLQLQLQLQLQQHEENLLQHHGQDLYCQVDGAYAYDASTAQSTTTMMLPPLVDDIDQAVDYADLMDQATRYAFPVKQGPETSDYAYPIYQDNNTTMAKQEAPPIKHQQQPRGWVQRLLLEGEDEDVLQLLGMCCDGQWVDEKREDLLLPQQQAIFDDFKALLQN